mmetsp:Transcript_24579/g.57270  ORF Transcript_24579/g.57270 Transcript_24579/m.57270 type:complete len:87 (-) Transcript_24579:391-651(-)
MVSFCRKANNLLGSQRVCIICVCVWKEQGSYQEFVLLFLHGSLHEATMHVLAGRLNQKTFCGLCAPRARKEAFLLILFCGFMAQVV